MPSLSLSKSCACSEAQADLKQADYRILSRDHVNPTREDAGFVKPPSGMWSYYFAILLVCVVRRCGLLFLNIDWVS